MAFREKLAWLNLVAMLIAYGVYFALIGPATGFGEDSMVTILWSFGPVAAAHALAVMVGAILLAVLATGDASSPADERDRAIDRRGTNVGFYILITGMILVGVVMPFSSPAWKIVNVALAVIVIAETVHQLIVVISYRRGWNG